MQSDENKIMLYEGGSDEYNCVMILTKKSALTLLPLIAIHDPNGMIGALMTEMKYHVEVKANLSDDCLEIIRQAIIKKAMRIDINLN